MLRLKTRLLLGALTTGCVLLVSLASLPVMEIQEDQSLYQLGTGRRDSKEFDL